MKKKLMKRVMPTLVAACLLAGTMVYGATFDFDLNRGETAYTTLVRKATTNEYARVQKQNPASPETTIYFAVVNSANLVKSEVKGIYGVGTTNLSYDGYNVLYGDYVKLRGFNNPGVNAAADISGSGTWTP